MYGLIFVILGNLAGNAVAFGIYIMQAAGVPDNPGAVRGLAVASLTIACLIHGLWRRGGIYFNNALALVKVLILLAVIVIGFAAAAGASFGNESAAGAAPNHNFKTSNSFAHPTGDAGSYARSFVYVVYSYSGFKQPFYVISDLCSSHLTLKLTLL